ncbi:MAG: helix-turn-helix transcriptional regulator [Litorilinea sp.]
MAQDFLVRRIRESVLRLTQNPERSHEAFESVDTPVRDSIRRLARSRISQILQQLRAANGLSYAQVQANTGLSQQLIYDVEYGDRRLTLEELQLLADCYHVAVSDLLGIDIDTQ